MKGNRSRDNRPPISVKDYDRIRDIYWKSRRGEWPQYMSIVRLAKDFGYTRGQIEGCLNGATTPGRPGKRRPSLEDVATVDAMIERKVDNKVIAKEMGVGVEYVQKRAAFKRRVKR